MPDHPSDRTAVPPAAPLAWHGIADHDALPYGVEVSSIGARAVLAVRGEIDLRTAPLLSADLDRAIGDGATEVVVDLGRLEFIDSSGLSVLVKATELLRARQGDLVLRCVTPRTRRVLDVAGLTRVLSLESSEATGRFPPSR